MDDNELENERDKREHELALARLNRPRGGMAAFWDMVSDNFMWVFFLALALASAYVKLKTGKDWY